jgi:hypothetical protein
MALYQNQHQQNWPPRYNWNIVDSGVKHNKANPSPIKTIVYNIYL